MDDNTNLTRKEKFTKTEFFLNKFIQRKSFAFTSVRSSMIHSASFYSSDSSLTDDDEPILHISDDGTGFI